MKLQEVFDALTSGELSQLSIGGQAAGVIDESNWSRVLPHISLGLGKLYQRFLLKEGRLVVQLRDGVTLYSLKSAYALSNRASMVKQADRYLLDTPLKPFRDDIIKVERVLVDGGMALPLNNLGSIYSVQTPTLTSMTVPADIVAQKVPDELKTANLTAVYRATHPKLDPIGDESALEDVELELPDSHLTALVYFVASRVTSPMGAGQLEGATSGNWYARFEAECQDLENRGIQVDRSEGNDLLRDRGFV